MSQIVLKLSQSDCAAFVACGEQGLTDRGVLHPLTAYAIANGIEASLCQSATTCGRTKEGPSRKEI